MVTPLGPGLEAGSRTARDVLVGFACSSVAECVDARGKDGCGIAQRSGMNCVVNASVLPVSGIFSPHSFNSPTLWREPRGTGTS